MSIRKRAEEIAKSTNAVDRIEILIRNQIYLDDEPIRAELSKLGWKVMTIGEGYQLETTYSNIVHRAPPGETASQAIKATAKALRSAAKNLEALVK